jgi:hypothetical protein
MQSYVARLDGIAVATPANWSRCRLALPKFDPGGTPMADAAQSSRDLQEYHAR